MSLIKISEEGDENNRISEEANIPIRSDEVHEIISKRSGFISRWALMIFLFILLLLISATWFIKYPDTIKADAILLAFNAPVEIIPRQDGKIEKLFVSNDQDVKKNESIAWIESTASHPNIIALSALLDSAVAYLSKNQTEKMSILFMDHFYNLGELQPAYQQFVNSKQQFNDYLINGYYFKRKKSLSQELFLLKRIKNTLQQKKELAQQDLLLTQESMDANNSLFNDKVISSEDLRQQKSKLVNKKLIIPELSNILLDNENLQKIKQKEIDELEHNIGQQKNIFQQELLTISSLINSWMMKYIIKAPLKGKIVFIIPLQENQFIQSEKSLGFINPEDSRYYAQVNLPQFNLGKVILGQKVQLRFDAYPYAEFGFLEGKIAYISTVPSDSGFLANIELPNTLITNYNREIQYRYGLKSQALIITRNVRLFQRFYYNLKTTK